VPPGQGRLPAVDGQCGYEPPTPRCGPGGRKCLRNGRGKSDSGLGLHVLSKGSHVGRRIRTFGKRNGPKSLEGDWKAELEEGRGLFFAGVVSLIPYGSIWIDSEEEMRSKKRAFPVFIEKRSRALGEGFWDAVLSSSMLAPDLMISDQGRKELIFHLRYSHFGALTKGSGFVPFFKHPYTLTTCFDQGHNPGFLHRHSLLVRCTRPWEIVPEHRTGRSRHLCDLTAALVSVAAAPEQAGREIARCVLLCETGRGPHSGCERATRGGSKAAAGRFRERGEPCDRSCSPAPEEESGQRRFLVRTRVLHDPDS
jgi:hypothetical protein